METSRLEGLLRASEEFQASMGFAKAEIERLRAALKAADVLAHQYPFSEFHERYWQARGGHEACTVCEVLSRCRSGAPDDASVTAAMCRGHDETG